MCVESGSIPKPFSMSEQKVTIRQLARLSGVSVGTVSRALNGYADVNPDTRERIERLARELDYTPAAAARSLKTQRSHVIGVFLETGEGHPDLRPPALPRGARGVQAHDRRRRLRPAAVRVGDPGQRLRRALLPQALPPPQRRGRRADGRRPRERRGATAAALRGPLRGRRRRACRAPPRAASRPTTRAARASPCATSTSSGTVASRPSPACSSPRPARRGCAATGASCRRSGSRSATSSSPTETSTPTAAGPARPSCWRSTNRRRRCSRPRT